MARITQFSFCSLAFLCLLKCSSAVDFISANQTIRDGETIVSAGENFEMGFFSPGNSKNRFLGIWYKKISTTTVVWVANREIPITNTSGMLRLNPQGVLEIQNASGRVIWSSNFSGSVRNPVAQLLDTGNLVIKVKSDSNPDNFIWQSFDFPGDTHIPGMKVGKNLVTGKVWSYTSWKSPDDPSPGNFTALIDPNGFPQIMWKKGSEIVFRAGPWNGVRFTGEPNMKTNPIYTFGFVLTPKEVYFHFDLINSSVITRVVMTPNGEILRYLWIEKRQDWTVYVTPKTDSCDRYKLCGAYGSCNINNSPACGCLEGFEPINPDEWKVADWSQGCRRTETLDCGNGEGFQKYSNIKLPDTQNSWFNLSTNLDECKKLCTNNCTCTAYTNADIRGSGSGCILWFGDLLDIRELSSNGQDIFIRMAASALSPVSGGKDLTALKLVKIITPVIIAVVILLGLVLLYIFKQRKLKREGNLGADIRQYDNNESQNEDLELPLFKLATLLEATNNFSINHKLGEGGFGPVYKGKLITGQDIAVKRLSKNSRQGLQEFKNEILLISKLQHRNLVKILGCCLEGEERMIAYEYMPNKSLDFFLFDKEKRGTLTWKHRIDIAIGTAKGLLYLHHDSRLRIIHRDLKAGNVLLDKDLNPKISDFGTARIFGEDQCEGRTKHVIGTYGYMSPEYAIHGKFSVKSDVFSFGVLLMEIVSGKKNTNYCNPDHRHGLLGHAWRLWKEGKGLELVDEKLKDSCAESQVLRCIQVGLLCIQKFPKDRPAMSSVVFMLCNEGAILPKPNEPGFYTECNSTNADMSPCEETYFFGCEVTVTMPVGR